MRFIFIILRWFFSIPLYIIKYPITFLLKIGIILFSIGAIICLLFAVSGGNEILYMKALEHSVISAASGLLLYLFDLLLRWISPFYGWLEKRAELKYFDREYRLDQYKNKRRFNETGFDEWTSQEVMFYQNGFHNLINDEQQKIEDQNNQINNHLIHRN